MGGSDRDIKKLGVSLNPYGRCDHSPCDHGAKCESRKLPFQEVYEKEAAKEAMSGSGGVGPAISRAGVNTLKVKK